NLAPRASVLKQGLLHLNEVLQCLEHLSPCRSSWGQCFTGRTYVKLLFNCWQAEKEDEPACSAIEFSSSSVTSVTESSSTCMPSAMDAEDSCHCIMMEDNSNGNQPNGRALAELFGLLVKLCVGSPMRQRRGQQIPPSPSMPSPAARAVATALTRLLAMGLSWEPPPSSPVPKFR
ncbi:e3 ubiquitin-protein ligase HUWE1, partial [Caerostris extrusa]